MNQSHTKDQNEKWLYTISPKKSLLDFNFREIWRYRDLLFLFVKRDIVTVYKQTILGPLWFLIQPLFTAVIFTLIFNNLANFDTGKVPAILFQMTGITAWNYFRECLTATSSTFTKNQNLFGKVYFPRVIMPMSVTISNLLKLGIQLLILGGFYIFYWIEGVEVLPNEKLYLLPMYIIMMAMSGLGLGMIVSSFTTKYRDLTQLLTFGVQLLMYISAVPYTMVEAHSKLGDYYWVMKFNPLAHIIEGFRFLILNIGVFSWSGFLYAFVFSLLVFFTGLAIFNKTEKSFIDTV
jgi:lipopolysaccharide transport system permease protein